ncbi:MULTISPECIES: lytic transglycosylase domain-containing protein [Pseudomonas syringae group]|uniref:lytic transglycosylase domain-containing protein n=1 Tax=Pseudomonas syringae group TaxID=136849 RepID=UPI00106871C7|nr:MULTISPECIES: lytic transglycosylase domain-containing protein [Pseudomonas syringae group]QOQ33286.1 Bores hole in peptidoglycan layer allowing type IV secretion complex assembly to occur (VirB1) [Pseudomonas syringae pv. actinidiae]TES72036.1 traL protein [Pseudomonas syringae pv. tomato]
MIKSAVCSLAISLGLMAIPALAQADVSASVMELAKKCAPNVNPLTMGYLVGHESTSIPYRLNVNGGHKLPMDPKNEEEAKQVIEWLQARNYNFDVGYGQVNSANFAGLGVTAENMLDGCNNLRAAAVVLTGCYERAVKTMGEGQKALRHALSCYNTGSQTKGIENGYVAKVESQMLSNKQITIPALVSDGEQQPEVAMPAKDGTDGEGRMVVKPKPRSLGTKDAFSHADGGAFSHADSGAFADSTPDAFQTEQDSPEQ